MPTRRRTREWWFWFSFVPWIGGVPPLVVAVRRRLGRWIAITAVPVLAFLGLITWAGIRYEPGQPNNGSPVIGGLVLLIWAAQPCIAYLLPAATGARRRRRPWPTPTVTATSFTVRYGITAYAITFTIVFAIAVILHFTHSGIGLALSVVIVDAILLSALIPLIRRDRLRPADLGLRWTRGPASTGWAILAVVTYGGFIVGYYELFLRHDTSHPILSQGVANLPTGTFEVIFAAFALSVAAPVTEEIFFRGLLFRALRNRMGLWPAALAAGCAFGLVHITGYPLDTLPIKACFGVLMCLLYNRTNSLLPCIAAHAFVDGSVADAAFTGNDTIVLITLGALLLTVLIVWPILARLIRGPVPQPSGTEAPPAVEDALPAIADTGQI